MGAGEGQPSFVCLPGRRARSGALRPGLPAGGGLDGPAAHPGAGDLRRLLPGRRVGAGGHLGQVSPDPDLPQPDEVSGPPGDRPDHPLAGAHNVDGEAVYRTPAELCGQHLPDRHGHRHAADHLPHPGGVRAARFVFVHRRRGADGRSGAQPAGGPGGCTAVDGGGPPGLGGGGPRSKRADVPALETYHRAAGRGRCGNSGPLCGDRRVRSRPLGGGAHRRGGAGVLCHPLHRVPVPGPAAEAGGAPPTGSGLCLLWWRCSWHFWTWDCGTGSRTFERSFGKKAVGKPPPNR